MLCSANKVDNNINLLDYTAIPLNILTDKISYLKAEKSNEE